MSKHSLYSFFCNVVMSLYSWTPFAFDLEYDSDGDGKPDDVLVV